MLDEYSFRRAISEFRIKFTILLYDKIEKGLTKLSKDQVTMARLTYHSEENHIFTLPDEIEKNINEDIRKEIVTLWRDTLLKH